MTSSTYTKDLFVGRRRETREVMIGDVGIGGGNPLRVQSMINTDTRDVRGSVDQIEALAEVGCEIVRITVPSIRDAEILPEMRAELAKRNVGVPLVADIHFTPNAAMLSVDHVEKIRINPGNYVDKKKFEVREFNDADYEREIEKVAGRFRPLVLRCRERGVAMRIGTNHGSLSDRIMNRFGDTPLGMVESALEFLDVCEGANYHDIVFSMKASNTQVAIQAYRLLAQRLDERPMPPGGSYPFHIGVTEAGDGEDGRIKSAIGIGALLEDGLGDTIRVSLTEHPVREVPVAEALARRAFKIWAADAATTSADCITAYTPDPFGYTRRASKILNLGGLSVGASEPVRVELDLGAPPMNDLDDWAAGHAKSIAKLRDVECESLQVSTAGALELGTLETVRKALSAAGLNQPLAVACRDGADLDADNSAGFAALISRVVVDVRNDSTDDDCAAAATFAAKLDVALEWRVCGEVADLSGPIRSAASASREARLTRLLFSTNTSRQNHAARLLTAELAEQGLAQAPIVLRHSIGVEANSERATIDMAIDLGAPLCEGIGDLVSVSGSRALDQSTDQAYRVLQGARLRATRTEFISCPSCGRTLFDLEEVTARIKSKTDHLKGVKIAIMGCIVNGPGEMADADFGYVGSGVGRVTLYVGKEVFVRSIAEDQASDRLVELIKDSGRWVDPA